MNKPPLTAQNGEMEKEVTKVGEMPQLSADMEKLLMDIDFKYDHLGTGNNPSGYAIHNSDCTKEYQLKEMFDEMKALLATALEEQRKEILSEVVEEQKKEATLTLMNTTKPFFDAGYDAGKKNECQKVLAEVEEWADDRLNDGNFEEIDLLNELRAKLNQLKGGE